jgi:NitT/TauT family transport system ATP-binding protein
LARSTPSPGKNSGRSCAICTRKKVSRPFLVTHDLREAVFLADKVFVMSARPGTIIREREVPFERPRPIELTYESAFNDIVHELRDLIADARAAA